MGAFSLDPAKRSKLNDRHELIAHLFAAGYTNAQCKKALARGGISLGTQPIAQLRARIRDRVKEIQREYMGATTASVLQSIATHALPSLDTVADLRDGAEEEGVRLRAATYLVDQFMGVSGLARPEGQGPSMPVLTDEDTSLLNAAIEEAEFEVIEEDTPMPMKPKDEDEPLRLAAPKESPRTKTIKELRGELPPGEHFYESAAC